MAVWLYREIEWPPDVTTDSVVQRFLNQFHITPKERIELFDTFVREPVDRFQDWKISWDGSQEIIGLPPDAPPKEGGILSYLELRGIGPAKQLLLSPPRELVY